jgi:hypothetical protein
MEREMPAQLRARFGYPPESPVATVDGVDLRGARMSVTGQGFGDFRFAAELPRAEYAVRLPVDYLLERMEREHASYVEDALAHPGDEPFERAQRERGWPAPREMLADPVLLPMILAYHAHDLLVWWLGDGQPPELPGWVAHSVTRHAVEGDTVVIGGVALPAGR